MAKKNKIRMLITTRFELSIDNKLKLFQPLASEAARLSKSGKIILA